MAAREYSACWFRYLKNHKCEPCPVPNTPVWNQLRQATRDDCSWGNIFYCIKVSRSSHNEILLSPHVQDPIITPRSLNLGEGWKSEHKGKEKELQYKTSKPTGSQPARLERANICKVLHTYKSSEDQRLIAIQFQTWSVMEVELSRTPFNPTYEHGRTMSNVHLARSRFSP